MVTRRAACAGLGATAMVAASWDGVPVLVQGDAVFTAQVREALASLADRWGWLVDLLDVIRVAESGELPRDALAGLLLRPNGYVAILNRVLQDVAYTASVLAHEAWHAHQHAHGRRYYGRLAEQEAWALQAVVLADMMIDHEAVPWLLSSIAGLPDSEPLNGNPRINKDA